jgi:hypothetical protein
MNLVSSFGALNLSASRVPRSAATVRKSSVLSLLASAGWIWWIVVCKIESRSQSREDVLPDTRKTLILQKSEDSHHWPACFFLLRVGNRTDRSDSTHEDVHALPAKALDLGGSDEYLGSFAFRT